MSKHWVVWLLVAGLFSVALTSPFRRAYAADPNAVEQLRHTQLEDQLKDLFVGSKKVDLSGADLSEANLSKANLFEINLSRANLRGTNLSGAHLHTTNLSGADLVGANLSGAVLFGGDLSGADLSRADLGGARLLGVNLSRADLSKANLSRADLGGSNLSEADLAGANLSEADLSGANLSNARFEPIKVPPGPSFLSVKGLDTLSWEDVPTGIILLRNAFKEAGLREQERQVTYAQWRTQRVKTGGLEGTLQYIFFEATSDWGMSPARPFWIMLGLIPLFALLYTLPVARPSPKTAVWRIWEKDRARKDQGQDDPEQLTVHGYHAALYALFFSVLSAFQIGWRELNVGSWIARLNPYEFTLKGTGWVRTVSGIQSLISVYLLALAVLTYFGRPFE